MASIHDPLLQLLRDDPTPLLTLLRTVVPEAASLPLHGWRATSEAFGRARFRERRPDLVLVHPEVPVVLVIELQNRVDPRKLRTWPYYAATASLRHDKEVLLVVFTLRRSVVDWVRALPPPLWCHLRPVVIGPEELTKETTSPALAVLAALAGGDLQRVEQAVAAVDGLDEASRMAYLDLLREHLSGRRVVALLEAMMARKRREYPGYQKLIEEFSRMVGREEGLKEGLKEGLEKGMERGMEKGLERGMEKGLERGMEKGLAKGLEQGLEEGKIRGKTEGVQEGSANTTRSLVADILRRLGREAEIAAVETLDLPALQQRLQHLLEDLAPVRTG